MNKYQNARKSDDSYTPDTSTESNDDYIARLMAYADRVTPEWKKELMRLIKKPNLTDAEIARMSELADRQAKERVAK